MLLSDTALKRPVLAVVINLLLVVAGVMAVRGLPVRQYPDIDPPVITVNTTYTGASAAVVESTITKPMEEQLAAVSGIRLIQATSYDGSSSIQLDFGPERDLDAAAADVRDQVAQALRVLPDEADQPVVIKESSSSQPMMWMSLTSETVDQVALSDLARRSVIDRLSVIDGVSRVIVGGERTPAMRIWLDPAALALRGLTVGDVVNRLRAENIEIPAGRLESSVREVSLRVLRGFERPEQFSNLVLRQDPDRPVRLGDVARLEMGAATYRTGLRINGENAVGMGVIRQSQANTVAISDEIRALLPTIQASLPAEIDMRVAYDEAVFIKASQDEVLNTLYIAFGLVVVVIWIFLRSLRATLVPTLAIPVSLVATFAVMAALGFSLNVLTMLALVLAIGLVVDDAIVVLENVHRRIELGESPLIAAYRGTREVGFAVVATTAVLVATFIPLSFQTDAVGRLFSEFGITMAASVVFSSVVALTWSPVLCARVLKAHDGVGEDGPLMRLLQRGYAAMLRGLIRPQGVVLSVLVLVCALVLGLYAYVLVPKNDVPPEDRGFLFTIVNAPQGSSLDYTLQQVQQVEAVFRESMTETGPVATTIAIVAPPFRPGASPNQAFVLARLKPWADREVTQQQLQQQLFGRLFFGLPGAQVIAINPPSFPGVGFGQPVQMAIGAETHVDAQAAAERLAGLARGNPLFAGPRVDANDDRPQLQLRIDRDRAADLGVTTQDIGVALQVLFGGSDVTRFEDRGRQYDVIVQAVDERRVDSLDLNSVVVRGSGGLVPLAQVVSTEAIGAPRELARIQRRPTVTFQSGLAPGASLRDAISWLRETAKQELPASITLTGLGLSRQAEEASAGILVTFGLSLIIVFLVLAAQFESWMSPLVIMLCVPLAISGALGGLALTGLDLSIYGQIGLVMLIGLMAKNGILIVEFANQLRDQGRDLATAAMESAALRLRPILMTAISTVAGAVPLIIAHGAGAEGRTVLGVVVASGLSLATILTLLVVPPLWWALARFSPPKAERARLIQQAEQDSALV